MIFDQLYTVVITGSVKVIYYLNAAAFFHRIDYSMGLF